MPDLRILGVLAAVVLASLFYASCQDRRADAADQRATEAEEATEAAVLDRDRAISERDGLRVALSTQTAAMDSLRRLGVDQADRVTEAGNVGRQIERDTRAEVERVLVQPAPPDDSVGVYLMEQAARLGMEW